MTTSSITRLLNKKRLTGEEVGRILIADVANGLSGKSQLTDEENDLLIANLKTDEDIRTYNSYVALRQLLITANLDYEATTKTYSLFCANLMESHRAVSAAEHFYFTLGTMPRILTKRDYERAKKRGTAVIKSTTYGIFDLLKYELDKVIDGETTEYEGIFQTYDRVKVSERLGAFIVGRRQKAIDKANEKIQYFKEVGIKVDDDFPPLKNAETPNKSDFLLSWIDLFDPDEDQLPEEIANKGYISTFKSEFPEFYQAVIDKYSKLKGLEFLATLSGAGLNKRNVIDFKTAFKLDILNAKKSLDEAIPQLPNGTTLINGVAVLDEEKKPYIPFRLKRGSYVYPLEWLRPNLAEGLLENPDRMESVLELKQSVIAYARKSKVYEYVMDVIAKDLNIKEVTSLKRKILDFSKLFISSVNICRYGLMEKEGDPHELGRKIEQLYSLGNWLNIVKISDAEKKKVADLLEDTAETREQRYKNILLYLLNSTEYLNAKKANS